MENINQVSEKTHIKNLSIVDQIFNTPIITEKDKIDLNNSLGFILNTYETVPMYRPLAIKLFGVLEDKDFPTIELKFHQCKVEAEIHAMELIRELHEAKMQQIQIEKAEYILSTVMKNKYDKTDDIVAKKEIDFDMQEQAIIISKKKFEYSQLEKKIKYRISEVSEWREIAETLSKQPGFKNKKHQENILDLVLAGFNYKLNNSETTEIEKAHINELINLLKQIKSKSNN